jgi:hypothetical protein
MEVVHISVFCYGSLQSQPQALATSGVGNPDIPG